MKSSLIASGLVVASLMQTAHGQVFDLPDPGPGLPSATEAVTPPFDARTGQFAGSLRLGPISRKEDGSLFRVTLNQALRLNKLDLRILLGKARLREAFLVTSSGNKIEVQNFRATGVLDTTTLYGSENFSLNEDISEILILAEAFTDDAELFITALSDSQVPRLTLWKAPMNTTPNYVPTPKSNVGTAPIERSGDCVDGFCVGDIVIFQRQRAKIVKIYPDGRLSLLQRGVRKILTSSDQVLPVSLPPYRG